MAYTHNGRRELRLINDPIDPDTASETFHFVLGNWLRTGETVTSASVLIVNGTLLGSSPFYTYESSRVDEFGQTHSEVYTIRARPTAGQTEMKITLRISTNQNRTDQDRTIVVPITEL